MELIARDDAPWLGAVVAGGVLGLAASMGAAASPGSSEGSSGPDRVTTQRSRCISVRVRDATYGLVMDDVREVIGVRPLTRVFHAPESVAGVMSLRGEILPVIDLGVVLGSREPTSRDAEGARIVVVREQGGARRRAGLLVDELGKIRELPPEGLTEVPSTIVAPMRDFVLGVIPDPPPCTMLGVSELLSADELSELAAVDDAES